jgi:hypothetical protein
MAGKMTLSEIEDRAKQMIQAACPDELMEVECITTDRETSRCHSSLNVANTIEQVPLKS